MNINSEDFPNSGYKFSGIRKRRCRRYIPVEPDEQLREFLRDRYRLANIKGTPPSGPFCSCGLQRDEHKKDAVDAAPKDVALRERRITDSIRLRSLSSRRKKLSSQSPRPNRVDRSQSPPTHTPPPPASDWDVHTDTVEEPTDVDFEVPISSDQNPQETIRMDSSTVQTTSPSIENLTHAPRVPSRT